MSPIRPLPEDAVIREHWTTISDHEIGQRIGKGRNWVEKRRKALGLVKGRGRGQIAPPAAKDTAIPEEVTRSGRGDTQELGSRSTRIRTVEELLERAEVDRTVWEVDRFVVNQWEVGAKVKVGGKNVLLVEPLYQVKAWLKRCPESARIARVADEVIRRMERHAPRYPAAPAVANLGPEERHMIEVCSMDLHIGKLAWGAEAGEDYDVDIARDRFLTALEDLIQKSRGFPIDQVLFPIGNDLLQIDSAAGTTTKGTSVDTDTRYAKMFERAEQLMVHALDRLAGIAPVRGVVVPGNHDRQSVYTLGRVLAAWYRRHPSVEIDNSPKLRKYHRYGISLVGYTHGSEEKAADLPLIMAQEVPELWASTVHREWHVGHLHKSRETRFTAGDSFNGVRVRIIPSLCSPDAWHTQMGYVGERKAAEAYLWSYTTGYAGHFSSNVLPKAA